MSFYAEQIRAEAAKQGFIGVDPEQIEAYMRLEHGCLDALSRSQFASEVFICIQCVLSDPEAAKRLVKTM